MVLLLVYHQGIIELMKFPAFHAGHPGEGK